VGKSDMAVEAKQAIGLSSTLLYLNMPEVFAQFINKGINEQMSHQKAHGWWRRWVDRADKRLFAHRMVYQARMWDAELRNWQMANCIHN
jgi:hypothetical protein